MRLAPLIRIISPKSIALSLATLLAIYLLLMFFTGLVTTMYSFYESVVGANAPQSRFVFVVSSYALSPFTSVVSISSIEDTVRGLPGVEKTVYEVITIGYVDGRAVVVRALNSSTLRELVEYSVAEGSDVDDNCFYCAWVGLNLAKKLSVSAGDSIALYSPFTRTPFTLRVAGVISAGKPYDNELIVPLGVGQAFRGLSRGQVSIAIIFLSSRQSYLELAKRFEVDVEKVSLAERVILSLRYVGKRVELRAYNDFSSMLLSRLGLPRETLTLVLVSTSIVLSLGLYIAGQAMATLNLGNILIAYELGVSVKKVKMFLALVAILCSLASFATALALAKALFSLAAIELLGHEARLCIAEKDAWFLPVPATLFTLTGLAMVRIDEQ
uniref:ABC transporter permease n=1 Tax=Ignisphaera aggregans TaxID=334771 RepID=A0A7C4BCK9_9CREN